MNTPTPTTVEQALDAIAAVRAAFAAEPDLLARIESDDADAYALGLDLIDRGDQAFMVASDLIVARFGVPVDQQTEAHVTVNDGLCDVARLDDLGCAVDEYRERRSDEVVAAAIEELASTLERASVVTGATASYIVAGLRAVVEQGNSTATDGFDFNERFKHHLRGTNGTPLARAS